MKPTYTRCTRCILDASVPNITFQDNGVCNYCLIHDALDREYPIHDPGNTQFLSLIDRINRNGIGKRYNCIVGVSGGRDSCYTLYLAKHVYKLRPLAVHFNDGFGNPVAGENIVKVTRALDVPLRTITSDWRESRDIRCSFLYASTPDVEEGLDIGVMACLYGAATKERISTVILGHSFRTEGLYPLLWNYLDGMYLRAVQKKFGTVNLRPWKPTDPGFHLTFWHIAYYILIRRIRFIPILYYHHYVRQDVGRFLKKRFNWVDPGAHFFDDLYQSVVSSLSRKKFGIDRRLIDYAALIRSGQMTRREALTHMHTPYVLESPRMIALCIKRLGMTKREFARILSLPAKTFMDYPNNYWLVTCCRIPIALLVRLGFLPRSLYLKYVGV